MVFSQGRRLAIEQLGVLDVNTAQSLDARYGAIPDPLGSDSMRHLHIHDHVGSHEALGAFRAVSGEPGPSIAPG
jgi:hypothetical protein